MNGVFITGTGTGVGKTRITGLLLAALRARGLDAVAIKPVQTGAHPGEIAPDLAEVMGLARWSPVDALRYAPIVLPDPVSPHLAAQRAGCTLQLDVIVAATHAAAAGHRFAVVEGAGGLLVPLNHTETMRDLTRGLGLPVIVVAAAGLGTINHSLLTLEALRAVGLEPMGVVLNEVEPTDPALAHDNALTIARLGQTRVLGRVPHGATTDSDALHTLADELC